jgi:hypothetical protein
LPDRAPAWGITRKKIESDIPEFPKSPAAKKEDAASEMLIERGIPRNDEPFPSKRLVTF